MIVHPFHQKHLHLVLPLVAIGVLAVGCAPSGKTHEPTALSEMQLENHELELKLATGEKTIQHLEQEIAQMKVQALEQEALINDLRFKSKRQQKNLDAAIADVVRAKAKLRSLDSKAEAATTVAEAEIALKALQSRAASNNWMALDEITVAEHLLGQSAQEFNADNYGGALYLANRTKNHVRAAQDRLSGLANLNPVAGETTFAQPVPLKVIKTSNLRAGPGLTHQIIAELQTGTRVTGFSYKGGWIHVEVAADKSGWIFQTLVSAR